MRITGVSVTSVNSAMGCSATCSAATLRATRLENEWRRQYLHLVMRRNHATAKVATARKLAVRLFWMWQRQWNYEQLKKFGSHAG